jgi:hypothetical protein
VGWLAGHRRLTIRYERQIDHSLRAVNCQLRSPTTASPRWRIESANGVILGRQPSASCALWGVST